MIEARKLSKRYGRTVAVDELSFSVEPGRVTGFVGPNGAGKSTAMRLMIGLDRPSSGRVAVNGKRYHEHRAPIREVGALLDASAAQRGRRAYDHLLALAQTHHISRKRVDEVVDLVGLGDVSAKRIRAFSLGMTQRLGIAAALLGDPETLILDEPVNGLDPDGVHWIRRLLQGLAEEGRTVLVSSHLMSEMALVASHLIVIGRGRILADSTVDEFVEGIAHKTIRVRSPDATELSRLLSRSGATVSKTGDALDVTGLDVRAIGELAAQASVVLTEIKEHRASLEEAFMKLTADSIDYRGAEERRS